MEIEMRIATDSGFIIIENIDDKIVFSFEYYGYSDAVTFEEIEKDIFLKALEGIAVKTPKP